MTAKDQNLPSRRKADDHLTEVVALVRDTNDKVVAVEKTLTEMNGYVKRHNEEIFGNSNTPGLIPEMHEVHDFIVSSRTALKIGIAVISSIGLANVILIVTIIVRAT